ncbi:MAG: hypothetical protein Tsb009_14180 [Planctomycetaceae bacterium]
MASLKHASKKQGLWKQIDQFFHAEEVPYGIAIVRMFVPWALLVAMIPRWSWARELYSMDGASTPLWNAYGTPNMLPEISGVVAVGMMTLLLFTLITASIGWCTRASLVIAFTSYTYLTLLDAISTMTKYSVIASHVLLILAMSQCGAVWSVDSWLKRRRAGNAASENALPSTPPKSAAWPRRLLQLLIAIVYFGAAMTKFHTPAYFSGDQMVTWMLTNVNFANPLGEWMSQFTPLIVLFSYVAVVWEVAFIFVCWRGRGRTIALGLGVIFHIMTTVMLGLVVFPMVCIPIYAAFFNEKDFQKLALFWRRIQRRFGWNGQQKPNRAQAAASGWVTTPTPVMFAGVALLVVAGGIQIEHWMDPFGVRRPEGPHALKELDTEYVETVLLKRATPVRTEDVISQFQAGTILVGGNLLDPRRDFKIGDNVTVQAWLSSPHEDMILSCDLHDVNDQIVDSIQVNATREMSRCNFPYKLTNALLPGEYNFVLRRSGRELMRKRIRITTSRKAPVAN